MDQLVHPIPPLHQQQEQKNESNLCHFNSFDQLVVTDHQPFNLELLSFYPTDLCARAL